MMKYSFFYSVEQKVSLNECSIFEVCVFKILDILKFVFKFDFITRSNRTLIEL